MGRSHGRLIFKEFETDGGGVNPLSHTVEMIGSLAEENVTPILIGDQAEYYVPIALEKVD